MKAWLFVALGIAAVAVAVTAVFAILGINRAGDFDQAIDGRCAPLVVLGFRGSGEGNLDPRITANAGAPHQYGDSELTTNGWEGETLTRLFDELSQTEYKGFSADRIPVTPIGPAGIDQPYGYDAIFAVLEASGVDSVGSYEGSRLVSSASRGAEAATHLIQEHLLASEGCPILPSFVIAGYSQGAMAARHTAELNPESVLGVVMIGDPYQEPGRKEVREAGADGIGIIRWKATDEQRGRLDAFYGNVPHISSYCHKDDPICQFNDPIAALFRLATGTYGEHMNYYGTPYDDEAPDDALEIAKLAYQQQLLAQQALASGHSVSWGEANRAATGFAALRTPSLAFAGSPTLFSAVSPELAGRDVSFAFDLDDDGVCETESPDGTIWTTFDTEGAHRVGVCIIDNTTGDITRDTTTVHVGPVDGADIPLPRTDPESIVPVAAQPPAGDVEEPVDVAVAPPARPDAPPTSLYPSQPSAPPVAEPSITLTGLASSYQYGDGPVRLAVRGGTGAGTVSYRSSAPDVASVMGDVLTIHRAGTFTITATTPASGGSPRAATTSRQVTVAEATPRTTLVVEAPGESSETAVARIAVSGIGTGSTPGGAVTLRDGATVLGTFALSNGTVTATLPDLSPGDHMITARYSGQPGMYRAVSAAATVTITGSEEPPAPLDSTVFFAGNGAVYGEMSPIVVAEGETIELPTARFERPGYDFIGWSETPEGPGELHQPGEPYTPSGDRTLYARWASWT